MKNIHLETFKYLDVTKEPPNSKLFSFPSAKMQTATPVENKK